MSSRVVILTVVAATMALLPPSARAGTFQVTTCGAAPGNVNNSWVASNSDSAHLEQGSLCPARTATIQQHQESGLFSTDIHGLSSGSPSGSVAAWTFTTPGGTTITHLTYQRYLGLVDDATWVPALRADGNVIPSETCTISTSPETCSVGGPGIVQDLALSAHSLSFGITCTASPGTCTTGASLHQIWASLYAATVTISDPTPPTLAPPVGALWAVGPQQGTQSLTYTASDDSGIATAILTADGSAPLAGGPASCDYTRPAPCPNVSGATLTLDTTRLSDGPHTLALTVTDAGANQASAAQQIVVDNHGPAAPVGLTPQPVAPGARTVNLTWADPPIRRLRSPAASRRSARALRARRPS